MIYIIIIRMIRTYASCTGVRCARTQVGGTFGETFVEVGRKEEKRFNNINKIACVLE